MSRALKRTMRRTTPGSVGRGPISGGRIVPLVSLLLLAGTLLAYLPALQADFLWDDDLYIVTNDSLRSLDGLYRIWFDAGTVPEHLRKVHDYSLTLSIYWVEWQLWGNQPFPYHLTNVVLHAVNAFLLWMLLRRLRVRGALAAAAIFAFHPLHVEAVAWISELKTLLSTTFSFLAMLYWLRFVRREERHSYLTSLLLGVLAMLSKITALLLPLVLLLLVWWRAPQRLRSSAVRLIPLFLAAAALTRMTLVREHAGSRYLSTEGSHLVLGFMNGAHAAVFYIGKLLWPSPLLAIYPRWSVELSRWTDAVLPVALFSLVITVWWWRSALGKGPFVATLLYLLMLAPTVGFIDFDFLRFTYVADHFAYPATAAVISLAAALAATVAKKAGISSRLSTVIVSAICGVCALQTFGQCFVYQDDETFWRHTVAYNPESSTASLNLALYLNQAGRPADAEAVVHAALTHHPDDSTFYNVLGVSLLNQAKLDDARAAFERAVALTPTYGGARLNLGLALFRQQRWRQAIEQLELLSTFPERRLLIERHLGLAYQQLGEYPQATLHFESALQLDPHDQPSLDALREMGNSASPPSRTSPSAPSAASAMP